MSHRSIALCCSLLLAACSEDKPAGTTGGGKPASGEATPGAGKPGGRDACALLTLDDVRAAYSPAMKKSEGPGTGMNMSGPSNDISTCSYDGGEPLVVVTLMATWTNSPQGNPLRSRDAFVESLLQQLPDIKLEKVEFQGLPAVWQDRSLMVFKEGVMLNLSGDAAPGKDQKQTVEMLMGKAVGRL